jgi:arginyl-tRNA synthetase
MNIFNQFKSVIDVIVDELSTDGALPGGLDTAAVTVEPPRDSSHGDLAANVALVLAKQAKRKPREIAELIAARLADHGAVESVDIAGPGFINLRLGDSFWRDRLAEILSAGKDYGASLMGAGAAINLEYVSINPTGPLHVGHARGAVFGDVLASLLEKVGYAVTREYYYNDSGAQIDSLARSTHLRYREALGETIDAAAFEGLYPGDYLKRTGAALADRDGDKWVGGEEADWLGPVREFAVADMMALIRDDLAALGVNQDVFTSEHDLVIAGRVEEALQILEDKGLIYTGVLEPPKGKKPENWEPRPQTLFRATDFGDDSDRPLKKADGSWTYFAPDIAYHHDKIRRGFNSLINVLGADHGGYVKRLKAVVHALSDGAVDYDIKICQMVTLLRRGEPVKMSKRSGDFITLRQLVDEVGRDVVRFIMLMRKNDSPLEFDLVRVIEQSKDNPVFYVQYAHARVRSLMRGAAEQFSGLDVESADLALLQDPGELALIKLLAAWPRQVEAAAEAHEPHRLAFYLYDLAGAFHGQWNRGNDDPTMRFIVAGDAALTAARLALAQAVAVTVASGLDIFGVEAPEEMR